ncbi:MAG: acyltransferase family protein [Bacillota bacterium]|nr:acyltransferase family protein [Bacillota bacterium]
MLNNQRKKNIDNMRGIGIILVLLGHTAIPLDLDKYIFSFHMPLFFFLSGCLFNIKKYNNFKIFLKRKFNSLIIPYISFSSVTLLFWVLIGRRFGNYASVSIEKIFIDFLYGRDLIYNPALWFLPCLFIVSIIFYTLLYIVKNKYILYSILILSAIVGYFNSIFNTFKFPWGIDIALNAVVFYGLGNLLYSKKDIILIKMANYKSIFVFISLLIFSITCCYLNNSISKVDMAVNKYGNIFYFYLSALSGIGMIFIVSNCIKSKLLSYIGKNSLILMCLHQTVVFTLLKGILVFIFKVPKSTINGNSLIWGIIITTISIVIFLPTCYIVNEYFYYFIGKSNKIVYKENQIA